MGQPRGRARVVGLAWGAGAPLAFATLVCGGGGGGGGADGGGPGGNCLLTEAERVLPATITSQTTLRRACSPYRMNGPVFATAPLTVEAGVTVEACSAGCDSRLTVAGPGARLMALGTEDHPVVFKARVPGDARSGEWTGIMLRGTADGSTFDHVVIDHAGGPTRGRPELGDDEGVLAGLVVWDTAGVKITNSRFVGNRHYGVLAKNLDGANDDKMFAAFSGNTFEGQTDAAVRLPVNQVGLLGDDNCYAGREASGACRAPVDPRAEGAIVEADQGDSKGQFVTRDARWRAMGVPLRLIDGAVIQNATLEIAAPNEVWVDVGGITVGLNVPGTLKAVAPSARGIKFLSAKVAPARGDWDGILFEEKATSASVLQNVEVAHAGRQSWRGAEGKAGVWVYASAPAIRNVHVRDSLGGAVHWNCTSSASVSGITFERVACKPEAKQNWGCPCSPFQACQPACE